MTSVDRSALPVRTCELRCPVCGACHTQAMPTDACVYYFECTACGTMLTPKAGQCCVFCSYGSVPCPPMQMARAGGDAGATCCG